MWWEKKRCVWLLGFEPRSPRPQRGILTTKLQPHWCSSSDDESKWKDFFVLPFLPTIC
ncbi:hypothetical protein MTR_8g076870 [Medicago truncatula]|uniref:Uncharacterized protein n=1 Tax=Medicago truncatula TaxID=3880 RepID=G7LDV5_MEDTR|nr:hypothetical protein MTR_8g076870 [Medicago truncatula]